MSPKNGEKMPIVTINMVTGRDRSVVQECLREVAKTVSRTLDVPVSSVRVLANEIDPELWAVGTALKSEAPPSTAAH
jgi:4-oxalocrotonate tautomerase